MSRAGFVVWCLALMLVPAAAARPADHDAAPPGLAEHSSERANAHGADRRPSAEPVQDPAAPSHPSADEGRSDERAERHAAPGRDETPPAAAQRREETPDEGAPTHAPRDVAPSSRPETSRENPPRSSQIFEPGSISAAGPSIAAASGPVPQDETVAEVTPEIQAEAETPTLADALPVPETAPASSSDPLEMTAVGPGVVAESPPSPPQDPVSSHRRWIGALLNATQRAGQEAEAQAVKAPVSGPAWMLLVFGLAVGASTGVLGLRRATRRPLPRPGAPRHASPARPGLNVLVERVARAPMDAAACFQLAVELLKLHVENDGLRFLGRAIRINPLLIVQLLQDPSCEGVRAAPGVKRLLAEVKREYDRRLLTGYA